MASDQTPRRESSPPAWWSIFIAINGVALIWYEAIVSSFDRPWLLAVAAGMVGVLPAHLLDSWLLGERKAPR